MSNKQQTAVEWLISQLQKTRDWQRVINEANQSSSSARDVIEQAKEMEKERIEKDYMSGYSNGGLDTCITPQQYYEHIYGGNK